MKGLRMIFTVVSFTLNATFKLTRRNHRVTFDDHFRRTISHKRDTIVSWVIWDFLKIFLPFFCFVLLNLFLPFSRYLIHVFLTPAKSSLAFFHPWMSKDEVCITKLTGLASYDKYGCCYNYMKMIHGKTQLVSLIKSNTCCEKKKIMNIILLD